MPAISLFRQVLGSELHERRKYFGLTREQLIARLARVGGRSLASWEQGTRRANIEELNDWCAALGTDYVTVLQRVHVRIEAICRERQEATDRSRVEAALTYYLDNVLQADELADERAAFERIREHIRVAATGFGSPTTNERT